MSVRGLGLLCSIVGLNLVSADVAVTAKVTPPAGTTVAGLNAKLQANQHAIAANAATKANAIPNLNQVTNGPVTAVAVPAAGLAAAGAAAAVSDSVYVSAVVEGIDFALLSAQPTLKASLEGALRQAITTGQQFDQTAVTVELTSGSVTGIMRILVPAGMTRDQVLAQLRAARNAFVLGANGLIRAIPGINAAMTGVLTLRVCGEAATRAQAWQVCAPQVAPMAVEPLESMPAEPGAAMALGQAGLANIAGVGLGGLAQPLPAGIGAR